MRLDQLIKIRMETFGIKKEGFPIPSPEKDEDQDKFISRCIAAISDEYDTEQASAICYENWNKK